nr:probable protein phosphatase 2C 49 [Tanacetum cinerariifolium]
MNLFSLISAPNPAKVKTETRPRAAHEVPLLTATANPVIDMEDMIEASGSSGTPSTVEKSPLDFSNEDPPPLITERTRSGEGNGHHRSPCEQKSSQRGPNEAKANAPPKVLRKDHVAFHPSQSTLRGKSLAAIGIGTGSTISAPATQETLVHAEGVSDPDLLSYVKPRLAPKQDIAITTTAEKMKTMSSVTKKQTESSIMCSLEFNLRLDDVVVISEKFVNNSATNKSTTLLEESKLRTSIRSGSRTDIGARPESASYVKHHIMRLFFEDSDLPQTQSEGLLDELFLKELQECRCKAFLEADQALLAEEECSISDYCGTTALTVLILWRHLLIANAEDCRAVISRKGVAKQISHDHRPSNLQEKKSGGIRRLLCRWMTQMVLSDDDEFMIIGCDGIWDVMSNEEAVGLVRRQLMQHNDPERCARELIDQALHLHTRDNLTAIVVCFSSQIKAPRPWRPKFIRSGQWT